MLVGLDVLRRSRNHPIKRRLKDASIGLLTHSAAVDERGVQTLQVMRELNLDLKVVFSPEHGLDGVAQAEETVGKDDATVGELKLISLYGSDKESLSPKKEHLDGLDVLVIDLVDIGSRYYTYVWTALLASRAAAEAGVHVVVLDRPNPLSGNPLYLEGRPQESGFTSFVGLETLPIRHCMTLAEVLVSILTDEDRPLGKDGILSVISCEGWERHRLADAWGRPFVPPSPNMPTLQTAIVYPGGCLLEGTNLSEGRGTTLPFQNVGAPYLKPEQLAEVLGEVPGAWVRPTRFKPSFNKHAGIVCNGISLIVTDPHRFLPVDTYLRIVTAARSLAPEEFSFLDRVYEFEADKRAFDLLTGSNKARTLIEGDAEIEEVIGEVCPVDEEWITRVETAEDLVSELEL